MALTAEQLITEIESMTVLDLANLVKALEERFGV
ncbi:MAG TPA: 50S ribosomal protein L7/L12, partial [Holophagaceae bacterium]|nr:50S ribosomal protein L7/L12 [Holophagaceae bacterium]